ncbi:MAG: hypothetical protein QOG54_20, partial [Actinomycetota bacterium]|nr:hypothetical protein [Actinomycetota bacterium]
MLLPLAAVAGAGLLTFRSSVGALEHFRSETVDESKPIDRVRQLLSQADDVGESYVENRDEAMGRRFHRMHLEIDRGFEELKTLSAPRERELAGSAYLRWEEASAAIDYAISLPDSFHGDRLDDFHDLIDEAGGLVADAYTLNVDQVAGELSALQRRERSQLLIALSILALSSVGAGLIARRVRRSIASPLASLETAASAFGSDELSHRITVTGDDEL